MILNFASNEGDTVTQEKPDEVPQYKPGDIVNGHVLTTDNRWVPISAQTPPPAQSGTRDWSRRQIIIGIALVAIVGFLLVAVAQGMSQSREAGDEFDRYICDIKVGDGEFRSVEECLRNS
jgi:hypothetical protein